jgi:aminoglycoside 3-N-acetyltransferase
MLKERDVLDALYAVGIQKGDVVACHSFLGIFGQFDDGILTVADALKEAVGPSGVLIFPTYTLSFLSGEMYDHVHSPSEVGVLSEYFRTQPHVRRTFCPVYSHAIWGNLTYDKETNDILGEDSLFAELHRMDAKLLWFGTTLTRGGTFLHYFERKVGAPYRYLKDFTGAVINESGVNTIRTATHYARYLNNPATINFDVLYNPIIASGAAKAQQLGRGNIFTTTAHKLYLAALNGYSKDPYYLVTNV